MLFTVLSLTLALTAMVPGGRGEDPYKTSGFGFVPFSAEELQNLEDAIIRAFNEKNFLRRRIDMVKMQKELLFDSLDDLENTVFNVLVNVDNVQNRYLVDIKDLIKIALHNLTDLQAQAAGEFAVATSVSNSISAIASLITNLESTNAAQSALLARINTTLEETEAKLNKTLDQSEESSNDATNDICDATEDFIDLINTKICYSDEVNITIGPDGQGHEYIYVPPHLFQSTPDLTCGLIGTYAILSRGGKSHRQGYGYQVIDEREALAITLDCKALNGSHFEVGAFDMSRGTGIGHIGVTASVKACSMAPLVGVQ